MLYRCGCSYFVQIEEVGSFCSQMDSFFKLGIWITEREFVNFFGCHSFGSIRFSYLVLIF